MRFENELLGKPLTEQQQRDLLALAGRPEEDIDTSDIPEIQELPAGATRGRFYRGRACDPVRVPRDE